ncbi:MULTISPECIES: response regulator transcription factor [unclassified Treponema]|uniref:response regulator transcription factor n=1 Tax=unclassified Treponema TaxID=2638727 RepID=UPI001B17E9A6|nr:MULTISPECIES: response regulator transcription factor [unclassified Treponema]MBO6219248.1 response regulator transcription factor [Treponema sp.]MBQ8680747.1 response regulator transcription factor [Treponema sp.]
MRVLLVEDEEGLSQALVEIFKKNRISIDAVLDGKEGLKFAESGIYDVLILDIMLPGIDGISILKTLRENHNNVPVIFLTAKDDVSDKITGLDAGADDYLTKPFSSDELLARVRALSRRKGELKDDSVTFGDLTLNKKNCELQSADGEAIKLSLKEYQILDLLFENPHQIITKEQLIEKIWGGESNAEYNNVEVYISFIRKKIENLKVGIRIRTARGIGYSLEDETR